MPVPARDSDAQYSVCPNCGEDLPDEATFCRACGASDDSGWNEDDAWMDPETDNLSDSDFDYEEFIAREFPDQADPLGGVRAVKWLLVGIVVVLLIAMLLLGASS